MQLINADIKGVSGGSASCNPRLFLVTKEGMGSGHSACQCKQTHPPHCLLLTTVTTQAQVCISFCTLARFACAPPVTNSLLSCVLCPDEALVSSAHSVTNLSSHPRIRCMCCMHQPRSLSMVAPSPEDFSSRRKRAPASPTTSE